MKASHNAPSITEPLVAWQVLLHGRVQGIGYRPALARLAGNLGLSGWVRNASHGVEVLVEGPYRQVNQFAQQCEAICPPSGAVESKSISQVELENLRTFSINSGAQSLALSTDIPTDLVACQNCLDEVHNPADRRYGYLLTSCSQCGPRYTILESMPYERETTSLSQFELCSDCWKEYTNPTDRRFHAQTIGCGRCGPALENLTEGLECLRAGNIVCVKGVGGYQLLVDAQNEAAINRLRMLKGRHEKPFAVMIPYARFAQRLGTIQLLEIELLQSGAAPIVIANSTNNCFSQEVSRGLTTLGFMLPTTPIHEWLVREIGPLVVTSSNLEGEPIHFEDFQKSCDALVNGVKVCMDHDRPIRRPIDDSVVRVMGQQAITFRLARGLAPLVLPMAPTSAGSSQHILAVGGQQKVAIALANGFQQVLGPHLGDMDSLACRQRFVEHVEDFTRLYKAKPTIIAHDHHDDYFTTRWSKACAVEKHIRTIPIYHHHAHVVAGMIEPGWLDRCVLGVAWDGTGLGADGTIWGGEFLVASSTGFERVACLRPFRMPGGEAAIRQPWRIAASLLTEVRAWDNTFAYQLPNSANIEAMLAHSINSPITSSLGRLFDAVAAFVLPDEAQRCGTAGYEGHFAVLLESCCDLKATGVYSMPICEASVIDFPGRQRLTVPRTLDWRPMMRELLDDVVNKLPASTIAMRFHRTLALAIRQISELHPTLPVVLCGGVFQNKILVDLIVDDFRNRSLPISIPSSIPINDGGLAAGQLAIASAIIEKEQRCA